VPNDNPAEEVLVKNGKPSLSTTLESYLELISELQEKYGAVRVTDLAQKMGCKTPTATSALRRLSRLELIHYEAYRPVTLTDTGKATIRKLSLRHRILADFLAGVLALPADFADEEACRLEHRVSPRMLTRLAQYLEFLREHDPDGVRLAEERQRFETFLEERAGHRSRP
jgi:DtxR family Mn-dependent transcriptional regulator